MKFLKLYLIEMKSHPEFIVGALFLVFLMLVALPRAPVSPTQQYACQSLGYQTTKCVTILKGKG